MAISWISFDANVDDNLIDGEVVIDEVGKHWVARIKPALIVLSGILTWWLMPLMPQLFWIPLLIGTMLLIWGLYWLQMVYVDRLVVTNTRVFRVHGVFSKHMASMPLRRVLDVTYHQPFIGRILNYGHFVFESAAAEQGLRDVRYVASPLQRDLTIQDVLTRAGLHSGVK